METPSKKEFQIGWICALPIEAAAAIQMLDENFGILQEQERSDTNTYTLGRIGRHYIVIACLPDGQYGTISVTTVANNMMRTFSDSLRIGLMVGIGGGAPSAEHDIRLGDIVVSRPEGSHGGVIQYDMGKIGEGGKIQLIGSLNSPPKSLLNALAQMRAAELYDDPRYPLYIQEAVEKSTLTRKTFSRPKVESDRLFKIEHRHLENATSCDQCSVEWEEDRITREDHDPHTHYGTIASANTLIKDGKTREAIRKQTGALCFDMEAAGMMADFPCLVIRGICDYADSHNNKQWQSYAALAAAAYTKELLSYVPKMIFEETLIANICSILEDIKIDQKTAFDQPESRHREKMERVLTEDQRRCHQAFQTSNYENFKSINPNRVEGTCEWVLNSPEYLRWWNATSNDLLWISADPGCGKSVLAKSLIDEVFPLSDSNIFVLHFFFKDNEEQDNLAAALCAVLHQLFTLQPQLLRHALPSWKRNRENIQYVVEDLWRIFMAATSDPACRNTICVFDALDECRDQDQKLLIERLHDFHNGHPASQGKCLKFLVTSRPYYDIQELFRPVTEYFPQIHLRGEEENDQIHEEINLVVKARLAELGKDLGLRPDTQERLERELCEMKHRTYLWLCLAIDDIKETLKHSLRPDHETIPSLPKNVPEAYERILDRVPSHQKPTVETILRIIVGARRSLTVQEMAMALGVAMTPRAETVIEAGLSPNGLDKKIRQLCGLFVFIKEFKIYLIHQTAREFLIGRHDRSMSTRWHLDQRKTEIQMADICMKYLLMNDLVKDDKESSRILLDYSAENWADHFRDVVSPEDEMVNRAWKLYDVKTERFRLWFPIFWKAAMPYDGEPQMNAMHLAAFNGHQNVLSQLAAGDRGSIDQTDRLGTNALQWACTRGYFGIVHELLEKGADVNALGGSHGNALQGASAEGHLKIVQLLLEKGADVNVQGGEYGNALQGAAIRGHLEIVQLLLEKGADVNVQGGEYGNALQGAAIRGHLEIVQFLLEKDADVNVQGRYYGNVLQGAVIRGNLEIVQLLLEKGADVNAQGGYYGNALQAAAEGGNLEIVQLLLEKGADVNAQGGYYGNALQATALKGHLEIVQLLLEKGAEVNAQGGKHGNALQAAAEGGNLEIVQLLLEKGADVNAQGGYYGNALQAAAEGGNLEIVQLLLEKGADVNAKGGYYGNALQATALKGHLEIVQLLLEKGAEVNAQGGYYGNALQATALKGHLEIVQLLLEKGAEVNAQGGKHGNNLQAAAEGGHLEIVWLLLQKGADVDANAIQAASQREYNNIVQLCLGNADSVDAQAAEYIDKDYDTDSDLSDDASVFSTSSSQSFSSAGSDNDARQTAAQHLAHILYKDADLQHLYFQAMQKLGEDRFARNHDRLLKRYFRELRLETRDPLLQKTARFLQNQSQREQVTAMICQQIQSKSSSLDLSAIEQLRNKEDREYRLDLLLKKHSGETEDYDAPLIQGSEGYDDYDSGNEDSEEHEEENDANKEEEDREMKDGQIQPFSLLESVVKYFNSGASFEAFKSRLNGFINPPSTIEQALAFRDIKALRRLLKKQFNAVAAGDYSWINELDEIGYTRDDIADLLFEQANDTPWIYFEPRALEPMEVKASVHLPGCVHQLFSFDQGLLSPSVIPPLRTSRSKSWKDITRAAQELCGLAGIKPTSRDLGKWNGSVQFEEENSVALVSYSRPAFKDSQEHRTVISMISKAVEGFCSAAGHIQAAGLCCDSFTILRQPIQSPEQHQTEIAVEMCRVNFKLGLQMQEELKILSNKHTPNLIDCHSVHRVALEVLGPFMKSATVFRQFNDIATILHTCSLAVQLMCLGLLSYSQAHIGPIQTFFLDTALSKIRLLGSQMLVGERERIEVSLSELTCIGNMTGGPVLTFNLFEPQTISRFIGELQAYDLMANAEDLLDTWGPGQFIFRKKGDRFPCAIRLGDGFVWCSNFEQSKFHWSQEARHESISCGELNPCRKIIIGTSITVNENCRVNESDCWKNSSLEQLGPYEPYWQFDEKQYGFQAGNYFLVQVNGSSHKYQGLTLKQIRLHPLNNDMLISFLNQLWGVQVSFCTGVARRVPLHELVADMLPVFAMVLTNSKIERRLWEELETTHHIIDAFRNNRVHEFLRNLSPELYQQAMKMTRKIFDVLQHTGLNRSETYLLVAWPNERDIFRCFKVPCQKQNSWVPVLADSEDCATFAYISTKCFETENIKCGGPNVSWRNAIPLLETAVKVHSKTDTTTTTSLEDKSTYFFRKFDKLFFVQVKKPEGASTAILTTFPSNMPSQIKRRIFEKFMTEEKKVHSRLCEKVILDDIAEQVVVTMSKESL